MKNEASSVELFRFVTRRPFQKISTEKLNRKVVFCYGENPPSGNWYLEMLELKEGGKYDQIAKKSSDLINSVCETTSEKYKHNFIKKLLTQKLQLPIWKTAEKFWTRDVVLNSFEGAKALVYELIESSGLGNITVKDFIKHPKYKSDREALGNALVAAFIDSGRKHKNLDDLILCIRFMGVIEKVAEIEDKCTTSTQEQETGCLIFLLLIWSKFIAWFKRNRKTRSMVAATQWENYEQVVIPWINIEKNTYDCNGAINDVIHSVVTLPAALFPIKQNKEQGIKSFGVQEQKKESIFDRINPIKGAIDELKNLPESAFSRPLKPGMIENEYQPWVLSDKAILQLSPETLVVLQEGNIDIQKIPVPLIVSDLEKLVKQLRRQYNHKLPSTKVLQYGDSRIQFSGLQPVVTRLLESDSGQQDYSFINNLGAGDLMLVRQTLLGYENGEIAHIENVLKGEYKEREHRRTTTTEEEYTTETEKTTSTERDLQTSERFELKSEISETLKEDHKFEIKGSYGGSYDSGVLQQNWGLNAGYNLNISKEQARKVSNTYAKDVVDRSKSKIEEKTKEVLRRKTTEQVEETNTHGLDNKQGKEHIVGIYRWLDKIYEAEVVNYGARNMYEFIVPEPAAFYLYSLLNRPEAIEKPEAPYIKETTITIYDQDGLPGLSYIAIEPANEGEDGAKPLRPSDIDIEDFEYWIAKYKILDFELPPVKFKVDKYSEKIENEKATDGSNGNTSDMVSVLKTTSIKVSENYKPLKIFLWGASNTGELYINYDYNYSELTIEEYDETIFPLWKDPKGLTTTGDVALSSNGLFAFRHDELKAESKFYDIWHIHGTVGNSDFDLSNVLATLKNNNPSVMHEYRPKWFKYIDLEKSYSETLNLQEIGNTQNSEIPISFVAYNASEFILNVTLLSQRTELSEKKWQLYAYNAIINAYNIQKSNYEEQISAASIQEGISISGRNPLENRKIEEIEIKKSIISLIKNENFEGFNTMQSDEGLPFINLSNAKESREIQFLEQAFDWANMGYRFYPYFWSWNGGVKDETGNWVGKFGKNWVEKLTLIKDTDPLFEEFLKAGAARVILPVRRGYERALTTYLTSDGVIWDGGDSPVIDDPMYVSIVNEIMEEHGIYFDKSDGYLMVEKDKSEVNGVGTYFISGEDGDKNKEITIEGLTYIISSVESSTKLYLNKPYSGENNYRARYFIGVRHVGAPWRFKIPTALVKLEVASPLPEFKK